MADTTSPKPNPDSTELDDGYLFRSLLETSGDSIYVKDRDCRLTRVSMSMARNLGYERGDDVVGMSDHDLFGAEFAQRTYIEDMTIMATDAPLNGLVESRQMSDGSLNWTLTSKLPLHDESGAVVGLLGITREINELKEAESNLQYLATHDSLTGLPNRFLMTDRLNQVMNRAGRDGTAAAVLFVDIDGFKTINDVRGHAAGDELLRSVGERLRAAVRASDTVARIGGDEFVLVVEGADRARASEVARRIIKAGSSPLNAGSSTVRVTLSVGVALFPEHGTDGSSIITAADHAMYLAKQGGKNRFLVYPQPESQRGYLPRTA